MSAAISDGVSREIIRRWIAAEFEVVVSYDLLLELETVLLRDKFRKKLAVTDVLDYVRYLREWATLIPVRRMDPSPEESAVPDPDDEYLVRLAEDARADSVVSGDKHFLSLPQAETPREFLTALVRAQQERLTTKIPEYYRAYFSELRSQLERPDVFTDAVPDWMGSYKRVVAVGGRDGLIVVHFTRDTEITIHRDDGTNLLRFPSEPDADDDSYEFITFPSESVSVLANFIGGGEDIEIDIDPDMPWGAKGFTAPQQAVSVTGERAELAWSAPWTRMVAADFNSLGYWEDPERARMEALEDIGPYVRHEDSS